MPYRLLLPLFVCPLIIGFEGILQKQLAHIWLVRHILNCTVLAVCTACNDDGLITLPTIYAYEPCKCSFRCGIFRNFAFSHFTFELEIVLVFSQLRISLDTVLLCHRIASNVETNLCWYVFIARSFEAFFGSNTHTNWTCASYSIQNDVPKWKVCQKWEKKNLAITNPTSKCI